LLHFRSDAAERKALEFWRQNAAARKTKKSGESIVPPHQHSSVLQGKGVSHRVNKSDLLCFEAVEGLAWSSVTKFKRISRV
jgi:hypothetical protein